MFLIALRSGKVDIPRETSAAVTHGQQNAALHDHGRRKRFGLRNGAQHQVHGLPEGPSFPLPDCWPEGQYPLRKEWNPAYFNKKTMAYEPPKEEAKQ